MTATFWMLVRSLVRRVMREAEEKRSMSAKENVQIWSNSALRRLAPSPWAAKEAYLADSPPAVMATALMTSMSTPSTRITFRLLC